MRKIKLNIPGANALKKKPKYFYQRLYLKKLTVLDAHKEYVRWMNDPEITQYLESRGKSYTRKDIENYIRQVNAGPGNVFFGIFLKANDEHIGNIKIGNINQMHKFAEIGLVIGNKLIWGKGFGKEAIQAATRYAFEVLRLNKLIAGIYVNNIGSYKAFIKSGYREAGVLKSHRLYKGAYVDEYLMEKCRVRKRYVR